MRLFVTGSSGMLGRALCGALGKSNEAIKVSRSETGPGRCDLSDAAAVKRLFDAHSPDLVVHSAAYSDVDGCEREPAQAYASNASAVKNLSEICGAKNVPWIHVSTDYVFDGRKKEPYVETDAAGPINIYGVTKWLGEHYARNSSAPCAIARVSWLFGAGNPRTFVNAVAARLKTEAAVSVLDNQTTAPTSVPDLVAALSKVANFLIKEKPARWNETFHVCNRGGATHLEIAKFIRDKIGRVAVKIEKTDPKSIQNRVALRPAYSVMSASKFEKKFGHAMRPWQEALGEYIGSGE